MHKEWCRAILSSKRTLVALIAIAVWYRHMSHPRVDVPLGRPGETTEWVAAVVATVFGISSLIYREKLWFLSVLAILHGVMHLAWVAWVIENHPIH